MFVCRLLAIGNSLKQALHNHVSVVNFPRCEGSAMIHRKNHLFLRGPCSTKMPGTYLCHSLWQGEFVRYRKQVVNRLKIPQGLSTLIFRRRSEVLSRGLVRGDSCKKNDLLHKDATYMSVSRILAVRIHSLSETGRKQAQDPPGSLHTYFSSVE